MTGQNERQNDNNANNDDDDDDDNCHTNCVRANIAKLIFYARDATLCGALQSVNPLHASACGKYVHIIKCSTHRSRLLNSLLYSKYVLILSRQSQAFWHNFRAQNRCRCHRSVWGRTHTQTPYIFIAYGCHAYTLYHKCSSMHNIAPAQRSTTTTTTSTQNCDDNSVLMRSLCVAVAYVDCVCVCVFDSLQCLSAQAQRTCSMVPNAATRWRLYAYYECAKDVFGYARVKYFWVARL